MLECADSDLQRSPHLMYCSSEGRYEECEWVSDALLVEESELEREALESMLSSLLGTDGIVSAVNVSSLPVPSPAASLSALN